MKRLILILKNLLLLILTLVSVAAYAAPSEFCWRDSYGRGVGTVPTLCGAGKFKAGALCFADCPAGMKAPAGLGDCHSVCPDNMRDDGLFCRKAEYGRGAGYADWDRDKCEREQTEAAGGSFERVPGAARDIGVGANGPVWVIGTNQVPGGFGIYRLDNNGNWSAVSGGALRIDVERHGNAWVVNEGGSIYKWNGNIFEEIFGPAARDIGVGANGAVWIVGVTPTPTPGGFQIFRRNGNNWDQIEGGAVRIDVDPGGNAWIVNDGGDIWKWNGKNFQQLPGKARDIGIAGNGNVFVTAPDFTVYRWNGNGWTKLDALLSEVSGGGSGVAWGVTSNGEIYRQPERCEKNAAMWYPKCKPGYSAFGSNICRPSQPNCSALGLNSGIDLSCGKKIQLGTPTLLDCASDKQKDVGLCYNFCKSGYGGVGPVCWGSCPASHPVSCGAGCATSSGACGAAIGDMVMSVFEVVANIGAAIVTGGGSVAATAGAKAGATAGKIAAKTGSKFAQKITKDQIAAQIRKAAQEQGKTLAENTVMAYAEATYQAGETGEFDPEVLAGLDPTGIASVVMAYKKPMCQVPQTAEPLPITRQVSTNVALDAAGVSATSSSATSTASGTWQKLPGAGKDIGVGADGTAWVLGTAEGGVGGYEIYRFDGANWVKMQGNATRISVDGQGNAWVTTKNQEIYRWTNGSFQRLPGAGYDIGVNASGQAWVLGTNAVPGGFGVNRWNGSGWTGVTGGAVRIAVDPQGNAWVVNDAGAIFRWNGSSFQAMPGQGRDIGIGGDGSVFVLGKDFTVWKWNGSGWNEFGGLLAEIAVDGQGNPWGVTSNSEIFRNKR